MSTWYKRLREIREKHKFSQPELGRMIGIDGSAVSRHERGDGAQKLSKKFKRDLLEAFSPEEVFYIEKGEWPNKLVVQDQMSTYGAKRDSISIPVVSETASAGTGSNVESVDVFDTDKHLTLDLSLFKTPPRGKLRAIEVDGYSMIPVLLPQSWVIFEESKEWKGDGLYVLVFRGVLMVKQVEADPKTGNLWIKSANPQYDSWEYDPTQDQSTMKIVGRVLRCVI